MVLEHRSWPPYSPLFQLYERERGTLMSSGIIFQGDTEFFPCNHSFRSRRRRRRQRSLSTSNGVERMSSHGGADGGRVAVHVGCGMGIMFDSDQSFSIF